MTIESILMVNVKKWMIDYNTKVIEIEGDGYKILEDKFAITSDELIANISRNGQRKSFNFKGKYAIFQTYVTTDPVTKMKISFYIKFENNNVCNFIFNFYDSNSLIDIDTIYSEYELTRHKGLE